MQNRSNKFNFNLLKLVLPKKLILPCYHEITTKDEAHLLELKYFRKKVDFLNDLIFFEKNYKSISLENISKKPIENQFHLSFDDGMSGIYHNAVPILLKKKFHASVFVNSDFIDNKNMFYRHKISIILTEIKKTKSEQKISTLLNIKQNKVYVFLQQLKFSDEKTIQEIASSLDINFQEYLTYHKPYLSSEQLIEIKNAGFIIGNHGKSHINFNQLTLDAQKKQVDSVNQFSNDKINQKMDYFSFPFGDQNIKNDFFNYLYDDLKFKASFGVSGIKNDEHEKHYHRILMETNLTAEQKIINEYFKYILKAPLFKNKIYRK